VAARGPLAAERHIASARISASGVAEPMAAGGDTTPEGAPPAPHKPLGTADPKDRLAAFSRSSDFPRGLSLTVRAMVASAIESRHNPLEEVCHARYLAGPPVDA
jgi:hypothetical protein